MQYKARVYPLVDDETIIEQMRAMKLALPDGTPVAPEIWQLDGEEKQRMQRVYGTQGCYIDLFYVDEGATAGPMTIYSSPIKDWTEIRSSPGHGWVYESRQTRRKRQRSRNTRVQKTYAKRHRQA